MQEETEEKHEKAKQIYLLLKHQPMDVIEEAEEFIDFLIQRKQQAVLSGS